MAESVTGTEPKSVSSMEGSQVQEPLLPATEDVESSSSLDSAQPSVRTHIVLATQDGKPFVGPPAPSRLELARRMALADIIGEEVKNKEPIAYFEGKIVTELPQDLYIPPSALEVFLEAFEGPLDLLLYLIKKNNLDILNINVSDITSQYVTYIELAQSMHFELAAEYLLMAAMLAEIKSRSLLPRSEESEEDEEDPRAELIRRLQEYEQIKTAAENLDQLPREGRDIFLTGASRPDGIFRGDPEVDLREVLMALHEVFRRADMYENHQIQMEVLSTRERMTNILERLNTEEFVSFGKLFQAEEGRLGVVVTFLAVLELIKEQLIEMVQQEVFGSIHVKARGGQHE